MSLSEGRPTKVLSCASCRQRKIKCDKVQPFCTQCSRFGIECNYPSRKPTRRAPRPRQNELLDRISRLESIVGKADPEKLRELDLVGIVGSGSAGSPVTDVRTQDAPAEDKQDGAVSADASARYLSGEFWGNLCEEVEGIKQALDQPSDDDDDEEDGDSPESLEATRTTPSMAPSGFLFGNPDYQERDQLLHPPRDIMIRLWGVYTRNVDPLMKFLHRPTVSKQLQYFTESPSKHPLSPPANALFFAIYFSAITCLRPDACKKQFGESQEVLASRYRLGVERALAAADYLNTNSLEILQALTLYTAMIRCYSHNRNSWALTSLLIRLAQAQGLHRDGDGHRFTPYIAEMRRRVWYFIIVLDIRGCEDRGTDAILSSAAYNTIQPTPIDDEDFSPESTGPLIPKTMPADNVICMCTAMCSGIFGYMSHPHTNASGEAEHFIYTEDELIKQIRLLEDTFIHTAVPSHLPSLYASEIARVVILKLWLNIQYPFTTRSVMRPRVNRETMLRTAVSVLELWERMTSLQWDDRFAWWSETYVQWHPLAVALAELCVQPKGELADKAWAAIDRALPSSREKIADTASGSLWRPLKKLLRKARAARAEALMKNLNIDKPSSPTVPSLLPPDVSQPEIHMTQFQPTADFQYPTIGTTQPYDSMTMDPSYLFEYPPELLNMDFDPVIGQNMPTEWSLWNEFLNDTKMDDSPGSGGGDSF
ncbi:Fc.00g004830.m01.CDS01 [Cosmosporella sp. VM-42]